MDEAVIKVGGMSCQGCVRSVTGALRGVEGVAEVVVSLEAGEARVRFEAEKVSTEKLREAIEEAGFDAL